MEKIRGVNLGNWLVLEKWMQPSLFEGTDAEDEIWLNRLLDKEQIKKKMKEHRDTYVTEYDFASIAEHGMNLVRIPVPYFIFGDREPLVGCVEYLDMAFVWAEKYGLKVLIDLHTVPGSQNGYDNGGLTGVCKWHKNKKEVEYVLDVLEKLARRYGSRDGLFGIEVLNEPISLPVWLSAPSTGKARDKKEAKGSGFVPLSFLRPFYREAYTRLRRYMPEEKTIVFHDGFRLTKWNRFFDDSQMTNVMLDTHIYIFAMEMFVPIHLPFVYQIYTRFNGWKISRVQKHIPVVVGEWCLSNKYAVREKDEKGKKERFLKIAKIQTDAWESGSGWIYWNYQLLRDKKAAFDQEWKESWDMTRCWKHGWFPGCS